ncbi:hypothetical protein [Methanopyrus sp. SNP6]|uniref:hypothetical protein n=1 Tax=Methanopyrus sp. SNP6 TaxID=1937005 RepID=UPI0011E5AB82|nr:hypothetical protein [Methanopyrus sp. SNP6]
MRSESREKKEREERKKEKKKEEKLTERVQRLVREFPQRIRELGPVKGGLVALALVIAAGQATGHLYLTFSPSEPSYPVKNGDTVWGGHKIMSAYSLPWYSVWAHPFIACKAIEEYGAVASLSAVFFGVVPSPAERWVRGDYKVEHGWIVADYQGPGVVLIRGSHLYVKKPGLVVWGRKVPKVVAVKVGSDEIEVEGKRMTFEEAAKKYGWEKLKYLKKADIGERAALVYELKFTDGRRPMDENEVKKVFGEAAYRRMVEMADYSAVVVWIGKYRKKLIGHAETTMEGVGHLDDLRVVNAARMCRGWNGVIVPPHSWTHGRRQYFDVFEVPGYEKAAHGCCPPARALRDACLDAGLPKPKGIDMGVHPMEYGFHPTEGVVVYNTKPYPILIEIGFKGKPKIGGIIFCNIYALLPA